MIEFGALNALRLPDLWQQEALRQLKAGRDVVVDAPTGAGKTLIFEEFVDTRVLRGQAVYTVPTRALANDKRQEWSRRQWSVGIATGDVAENLEAPVLVATLETQTARLLEGGGPALLVIDEYQMLADPVRGAGYELAIATAPKSTQLLLLSGSVANAGEVQAWLQRLGRDCALVVTRERPVPLDEMPVESLPRKAPASIAGFWPRLAAEVLLADLGPLLIFAPRRAMTEKIARQIASALPADDPLVLSDRQRQVCGRELASVLGKRVAWHHSGLGYQPRAGVVEPLAKAGKLRVVVATTGLAAGINFSMRSVLVSETRYFDGREERELRRDELLQMFGRAGRRGLDTTGHVIVTGTSPRLGDAAQVRLRRGHELDWPSLLRVMHVAAEKGESPIAAAGMLNASLFATGEVDVGFVTGASVAGAAPASEEPSADRGTSLFGLLPTRREVMNSRGQWEEHDAARVLTGPLSDASVMRDGQPVAALADRDFMSSQFSVGRLCRIGEPGDERFGRELAIGRRAEGRRLFVLTGNVRYWLGEPPAAIFAQDQIENELLPRLAVHLEGGRPLGLVRRGEMLAAQLDFSALIWPLYRDSHGVLLAAAEERTVALTAGAPLATGPSLVDVREHSPAAAWRRLGLIDATGRPTRRGVISSFFHQGEGLAVAAALEDASLPVIELIPLLANLRAGNRFAAGFDGAVDRLAVACRNAYGTSEAEGYLSLGLPPGYGEGAAEVIAEWLARPHDARRRLAREFVGEGDLERTVIEWLSLLRHVREAPDYDWPRWRQLQAAAAAELVKHAHLAPKRDLPPTPPTQLVHEVDHQLSYTRLRR